MALQRINLGTAGNDGSGDAIRTAFQKVNDNFAELYGTSGEANSVKDDASPQLGGDLDVNGRSIVSIGNNNINIFPHGSGEVNIDQVRFLNSSITPNITNANLALTGNGTGYISLSGLKWPTVDGANGQVLQTNGAGTLSWVNNAGGGGGSTGDLSIVGSTIMAPSNADMVLTNSGTGSIVIDTISINQNEITANSSNANLELSGNGTGSVTINNLKFPTSDGTAGQVLQTDGAGSFSFVDAGTGSGIIEGSNYRINIVADDSSVIVNSSTGKVPWSAIDGTPTTVSGYGITDAATSAQGTKADSAVQPATLGNFTFTSSVLDSSDSSGITITPAVTMSSDLTVENNLNVTNVITANRFTSTSTDDPEIKANANLKVTAGNAVVITSSPVRFCSFTTTERDALASANGDMVYNSTTNKFQGYANGAWVDLH